MESIFQVNVKVSNLKKELTEKQKDGVARMIQFWITDVGDGFLDYIGEDLDDYEFDVKVYYK
jgi:hypothetical protein